MCDSVSLGLIGGEGERKTHLKVVGAALAPLDHLARELARARDEVLHLHIMYGVHHIGARALII